MEIAKIKIKNYRLLKDLSLDLEDNLSLVIGKNNTGKTSLLSALDKFIGERASKNDFSFDDFNIDFKNLLKDKVYSSKVVATDEPFPFLGISLKLFIEYNDKDDLSNISKVMMDLDPESKMVVLGFEYVLNENDFYRLQADFFEFEAKEKAKKQAKAKAKEANKKKGDSSESELRPKDLFYFLKQNHKDYFKQVQKTIKYNIDDIQNPYEEDDNFIDLKNHPEIRIDRILNFKKISAKRDVSNREPDKALSTLSSMIYKKMEAGEKELKAIEDFKDALSDTDTQLDGIFSNLFDSVIGKVKQFGGAKEGDSIIEIISTLQHRELLDGNTTVMYRHAKTDSLPENYNGLGYMNLISMIFQIEILLHEFKKDKAEKPADINLLFIEEPEAHTHPQMQYVFIKNIKLLLEGGIKRDDGQNRKLQTIISTHSSHIVSESEFNDIKYFKKEGNGVIAKNLSDLKKEYAADPKQYDFLKQYLTISRAELFFADKAILIEGDTEKILLPTIMKKIDIEEKKKFDAAGKHDPELPLLSQNISIAEVGAHCQTFEKFITFLGIKTLIITDLDSIDAKGGACSVEDGKGTSNSAIKFFFPSETFDNLKSFSIQKKTFTKNATWDKDVNGTLCLVYQTLDNGYHARSFEDAFIHLNKQYIIDNESNFRGIKNSAYFNIATHTPYYLATECIKKKTHFALDILYCSNDDFSNWTIPQYIKEGILWLKQS